MAVVRASLGQHDRLTIDGIHMRPVGEVHAGHILCHVDDPAIHVELTHVEFAEVQRRNDFRYEPGYFEASRAEARLVSGVEELGQLTRQEQVQVARAWGWASDYLDLERLQREGPPKPKSERVSRSDAGMGRAIARILDARRAGADDAGVEQLAEEHGKVRTPRKPRLGSKKATTGIEDVPCVKTLRKYVKLLERHGCPETMRHRTDGCLGAPRASFACEAVMARVAARFASETRPTKAALYLDLKLAIGDANKAAAATGSVAVAIATPSRRTFYRRVNTLHAYSVHVARHGQKSAEKKFGSVTQGLAATRPGEFVLIDEFRVPLQTIMIKSGAWELLSEQERKAVERLRLWVCVALDAATRVILAMSISRDQSTPSVLATLRMTMSDKGAYADAVGALSPWDMAVTPEVVMTDAGSTFISDPVRAALAGLRIINRTGPASRPMLRSLVERVFGTYHTQLLARFTGRTFANVVQKGDYDAEARASLTPEDLCWILVRYVVDQYHNSPHEGLGGETPANCWRRKTHSYPPRPLPDKHTARSVFGFDVQRRSGPRGVRILGLFFQGPAIQAHRRAHADGMVTVRVDEMDMGGVSVLLDEAWAPLRCATPGLDGVSLREWIATASALRKRHARDEKLSEPIVLEAIRAIQQRSDRCLEKFGLGDVRPSQRLIDKAERDLDIGWTMPGSETPAGDDAELFSGAVEATDAGHHGTDDSQAAPAPSSARRPRKPRSDADGKPPGPGPGPGPEPSAAGRRPGPPPRPKAPSDGGTARIVVTEE